MVVPVAVTMVVVASRHETMRDDSDSELSPTPVAEQRRLVVLGLVVAVAAGAMQWGAESLVPVRVLPLVATVAGLAGVLAASPRLVPRGTLRMARGLPSVMLCRFLLTASFNGAMTFVPLMLILSRGLGATVAGAMLTDRRRRLVGRLMGAGAAPVRRAAARRWSRSAAPRSPSGSPAWRRSPASTCPTASWAWRRRCAAPAWGWPCPRRRCSRCPCRRSVEHGRTSSSLQLADVLGSVMGIAAAGSVFAALHDGVRSDIPTFVLMWLVLAAVAALVVPGCARA